MEFNLSSFLNDRHTVVLKADERESLFSINKRYIRLSGTVEVPVIVEGDNLNSVFTPCKKETI